MLLADWAEGRLVAATKPEPDDVVQMLEARGIGVTTWGRWYRLDAAERAAGEAEGRERKKIVEWDEMVQHAGPEYQI